MSRWNRDKQPTEEIRRHHRRAETVQDPGEFTAPSLQPYPGMWQFMLLASMRHHHVLGAQTLLLLLLLLIIVIHKPTSFFCYLQPLSPNSQMGNMGHQSRYWQVTGAS